MSSASFIVKETKRQLVLALELRRLWQIMAAELPKAPPSLNGALQTIFSNLTEASLLPFGRKLWSEFTSESVAERKPTYASLSHVKTAFVLLQNKVGETSVDLNVEESLTVWKHWFRSYQQARNTGKKEIPPLPPVPPLDEVKLVKLWRCSAWALYRWEEWQTRLESHVYDSHSGADADWLATHLQKFCHALEVRGQTKHHALSQEWSHLYMAIDHLAHAFKGSVEEFQKKIAADRSIRSPKIDHQLTVIQDWIEAEFSIPRRLLQLARELKQQGLPITDFLSAPWEEKLSDSSDIIPESEGLQPLALVRAVLSQLDYQHQVNQLSGDALQASASSDALQTSATSFVQDILRGTAWQPQLEFDYVVGQTRNEETLEPRGRRQIGLKLEQPASGSSCQVRELVRRHPAPTVHLRNDLEKCAKVLQSPCPAAAGKCRKLASQLEPYFSLQSWLDDGDRPAHELLIWELVQLADLHGLHVEQDNDVAAQLQALISSLQEHGKVRLERRELNGDSSAPPVWMTFSAGAAQDALGQTRLLRKSGTYVTFPGDDSKELRPAAFAIVETTLANREILKFWEEAQGLLLELRFRQPAAAIWQKSDDWLMASLFASDGDISVLQQAFVDVYRFRRKTESPIKELATQLALRLRQLLEKSAGSPVLPILMPPPSLTPSKAHLQPADSVKLKWIRDKEPAGAVLKIKSFAWEEEGATATVSGGPDLDNDIVEFFQLAVPIARLAFDSACRDFRLTVEHQCRRAEDLPGLIAEGFLEMTRSMRKSQDAAAWNEWLHLVCFGPDDEDNQCRRKWFRVLTRGHQNSFYPRWDPDRRQVSWPIEENTAARQISWCFSELPLGVSVAPDMVQFAFTPDAAAGTFSLGPEAEGGILLNLRALHTLSHSQLQDEAPLLARHLRTLVSVERNRELRRRKELPAPKESPFQPLVDCLDELPRRSEISAETRDEILRHMRAVANYHNGQIFPVDWSYQTPANCQKTPVYQFAQSNEPAGLDATFALQIGADRWGDAKVTLIVGPAPEGWKDLCIAKDALPSQTAATVGKLLQTWPYASYKRDLIQAVVRAHIAWWDDLREESLAGNKKASKGFESALINILKPLKLNVYIPNTDFISNPQGYLEVVERRSGNGTPGPVTVCDILRPGILDQRNVLLCTASVIISE